MNHSRVTILGVPVDALTKQEALVCLQEFARSDRRHHVMTPNNEMLVEASKNPAFHQLLNKTDLNIADSTGLLWAARMTGQSLPERVPGVDTVEALCMTLSKDYPIFLLGAAPGVADSAASMLQQKNPQLHIAGTLSGSPKEEDAAAIVRRINGSGAKVLFVAFGAPAQDMWIAKHLVTMPDIRLAMGVGGTFDFIAGVQWRAPKIVRSVGLEWFWRLITQPRRLPRIIRAVLVFPWLVLRSRRRANPQ